MYEWDSLGTNHDILYIYICHFLFYAAYVKKWDMEDNYRFYDYCHVVIVNIFIYRIKEKPNI